jgi:hypothetical protein
MQKHKAPAPTAKRATIDYSRDVRPILAQHCFACHGADKEALKKTGNMRLDTFAGATADRGGYKAITPGHPEKSAMWARVTAELPDLRMPPVNSGAKPLTAAEKAILKKWIEEGAEYRAHWAFIAPTMPALPQVSNSKWARNDIDRFILARLDEAKLKPEPEADKATLIRRASLTLTGIPPTPAEVNAFLADSKPGAYERVVDKLLTSPRYGENQARYWLDAVRYADTHGLHIDNERAVYPYRDWVVRAYNSDLPFNEFAIWQLAGDLLPNPTLEQRIATGYVRMNPTTNEGGVIEAEFLAKNTMDRVDTTSTVFLGLTMGCAKCHDHKYDPISQKDYYSMYAFFNSTADPPLDGNLKLHAPYIKAPTPEQAGQLAVWEKAMRQLEASVKPGEAQAWLTNNAPDLPKAAKWEISGPFEAKDFDTVFATNFGPEPGGTGTVTWRPIDFKLETAKTGLVTKDVGAAYLRATLTVASAQTIQARLGSDDAIRMWVNGALVHDKKVLRGLTVNEDTVNVPLKAGDNEVLIKVVNAGGPDGAFLGLGDAATIRLSKARELAAKPNPTPAERQEILAAYLENGPVSEAAKQYRKALADYRKLDETIPYTYVAQELPKPRDTHLLKRGEYNLPGEKVSRSVPSTFGKMPPSAPKNRLGLAKWLTDEKNPLVSRVFVNRVWQQHFGAGLVKSSEDFGTRGEWPSHPELLDYLAVRFMKDGWSLKKLHRLILTSATFRQAATASPAKRAKDPENKLVSRMPRFRLDAEVIRDSALAISGLLKERPGGRGDKPYQPSGLWEAIAYPISDTAKYMQDHGDSLYRRSLYLFWKRTSPPPTMMIFDAPMRESCVVQRSRTNTPTQALVTLNETGFFEAARALAERVMKAKQGDAARIDYAFRLATGRSPSAQEKDVLVRLLADQRSAYKAKPDDALKALSIGESSRDKSLDPADHAAWMIVCNLILNLDETLTQH